MHNLNRRWMGVALAAVLALGSASSADPIGWSYKQSVNLSPATATNDLQVMVQLTTNNFNYGHAQTNGADVRFYTNDVSLSYWIDLWNTNGTSTLWVKVPATGTTNITLYCGNALASPASSGSNTFIFFDDFNRATVADITGESPSRYTKLGAGTWSIESQKLKNVAAVGDPNKLYVTSLGTVSIPVILATKLNVSSFSGSGNCRVGLSSCFGGDAKGYCTLLVTSTTINTLNDAVAWGSVWSQSWSLNTSYYMEHVVIDPSVASMKGRVWATTDTIPTWHSQSFGARAAGYVGFAGNEVDGNTTYFDDFSVRKYVASESSATVGAETIVSSDSPVISNVGSTNRTDTTADVVGTLVANGSSAATVYLYWNTTDGTTNASAWTTGGSVSTYGGYADGATFTNTIGLLTPNTTYYWNHSASNSTGTVWAATANSPSFKTFGPPGVNNH